MKAGELIFGTDGVRDRAGSGYLTAASVERLARATARVLAERARFPEDFPRTPAREGGAGMVLIGRDTRRSGPELSSILERSFRRSGLEVVDLGVLPTPAVARLAAAEPGAVLGVVVSASHNPAEYNGIKLLAPTGAKASPELERAVSAAYWAGEAPPECAPAPAREHRGALDRYVEALCEAPGRPDLLRGRRVVLDGAHGATYQAAPRVFRALGAEVLLLGGEPDGLNINAGCGALHPQEVARAVVEWKADIGFAFDGDGDRMIPVTAGGEVLDGDHVLAIAGPWLHRRGELPGMKVVATVMSNLGLEKALAAEGIGLLRTAVGDRHVYVAMMEGGYRLGGEQSGHLIFLDHARTGDGILAALRLILCLEEPRELAERARVVARFPQVLLNYTVPRRAPFEEMPRVVRALAEAEAALAGDGRIVLRYSGTEPLARVMIEGKDRELIERWARRIGEEILASF